LIKLHCLSARRHFAIERIALIDSGYVTEVQNEMGPNTIGSRTYTRKTIVI